jgi:alpha-L-fucosidase
MRYATFVAKHHDGFCLYDSKLTDFKATNSAAKRDLVAEFVSACRKRDIKIGLMFSLNDWSVSPNAVDALERPEACYQPFIDTVHAHCREILTGYGPIDILWYDGWWPYDGAGWQAEKLNAMARSLQPGILLNGRCGIPGDFVTPEKHVTSSEGMWEAPMPMNNNWCYHKGDHNWKSPKTIVEMLRKTAAGQGNLALNVAPKGDGSIPEAAVEILDRIGAWLKVNGEAIYGTDRFEYNLRERGDGRSDWTFHGEFTARGNQFYLHVHSWPGAVLTLCGLECTVTRVTDLESGTVYTFNQVDGKLVVSGLPDEVDTVMPVVLKFETEDRPCIYKTGGHRNPTVPHCRYDPLPSELVV